MNTFAEQPTAAGHDFAARLTRVRQIIAEACLRAGRDPREVTLVAATKTISASILDAAAENGLEIGGENRVQEFLQKKDLMKNEIIWHFIGQLQTNKVKYIVGGVSLIHTLDRPALAEAIQTQAAALQCTCPCLVQVNLGEAGSRGGTSPQALPAFLQSLSRYPNIDVQGLMVLPPPEWRREHLAQGYQIFQDATREAGSQRMRVLSMGMSHDYAAAIEEGATMVRVGRALFGERGS